MATSNTKGQYTKQVKLLTPRCGQIIVNGQVRGVYNQVAGEIVTMPADEAQRHIDKGYAVEVVEK